MLMTCICKMGATSDFEALDRISVAAYIMVEIGGETFACINSTFRGLVWAKVTDPTISMGGYSTLLQKPDIQLTSHLDIPTINDALRLHKEYLIANI